MTRGKLTSQLTSQLASEGGGGAWQVGATFLGAWLQGELLGDVGALCCVRSLSRRRPPAQPATARDAPRTPRAPRSFPAPRGLSML